MYKHRVQLSYNPGKPDLDINTEVALHFYYSYPSSFETKYVFTLLDQILVNFCRAEIAIMLIKPWLLELDRKKKRTLSLKQIRKNVKNSTTIDGYVSIFTIGDFPVLQKLVVRSDKVEKILEIAEILVGLVSTTRRSQEWMYMYYR